MDDFITEAAAKTAVNMATEIFKSAWQGLANIGKAAGELERRHDLLGRAAKEYARKMLKRYNSVKVLGMAEKMPLNDLFVRINLLDKIITDRQSVKREDLEKAFERDKKGFGRKRKTVSVSEVINLHGKFIVLGKPGAGKTTLLKHVALKSLQDAASNLYNHQRLPVFITLKHFSEQDKPLFDYMLDEFDICGLPDADSFLEQLLKNGGCRILLDGLDEVQQTNLDKSLRAITDFSDKYDRNQYLVSCRVAAYDQWLHSFNDVEIDDFNKEQIEGFVRNWFRTDVPTGNACWEKMEGDPSLLELATTPLLLTLLCIAYHDNLDFSSNRAELYEDAINALLVKWDSSRRIRRGEIYKNLSRKRKESLFSRVAYDSFKQGRYFLDERELTGHIAAYLANLPDATEARAEIDSLQVLKAIEAQHGLFVQRARSVHSFSHLTLQEYFTAAHIVHNAANGSIDELLSQHLCDPNWREVLLLVAGKLDQADELFELMQIQIDRLLLANPSVFDFIKTVNAAMKRMDIKQKENFSKIYNIFVVLIFARDFDRDRALALARALDRALARDLDFDRDRALALARARARDLARDLGFDLQRIQVDAGNFIQKRHEFNFKALEDYLIANIRLVECLKTDCYVSNSLRQELLDNLLGLPSSNT